MTQRFGVVAMQLGPKAGTYFTNEEKKKHFDYMLQMVDWSVDQFSLNSTMGVKLIVGPELSTYGWQCYSLRTLHEKYAIEIPGPETEKLIEKAKEYNCYISPGSFVERDATSSKHLIFNTQILVGPTGLLYQYRKVQPWWSHEPSVSPADLLEVGYDTEKYPLFPIADTEIGKLGGWICYDALFPEIARQYALNGVEIFLGSTAYMDPYGRPPMDQWNICCRSRSIENMAYGVYTGSGCGVSSLPSYPTSGGSVICDFEGRELAKSEGPGESLTYATLDIDALRDHRKHARLQNTLAHLRIEAYDYLKTKKCWTPQPQFKDIEELNFDQADEINCKQIERFWGEYYGEKVEVPRWRPAGWTEKWEGK
jgi:predicted amidohydrolase